jgi:hypothetical protein
MSTEPRKILVIELWAVVCDCILCGAETSDRFGIAIYEDEIVPDDYTGEWGGAPVCEPCFYLSRGYQERHPREKVPFSVLRALIKQQKTAPSAQWRKACR